MPDKNIHSGHRKRMSERFEKFGIEAFTEHEKLEMLLYPIIPRKNTNPIAHNLINKFGSLKNVLSAPLDELQKIDGIGKNAALQLQIFGAVKNYLNKMRVSVKENFASHRRATEYFVDYFKNKSSEILTLLLLDDKYAMVQTHDIDINTQNRIDPDFREIVEQVIKYDCNKLIIAHNRLTATSAPSNDDLRQTRELGEVLKTINIGFVDHIIVSKDSAISMRNYGYLSGVWEN